MLYMVVAFDNLFSVTFSGSASSWKAAVMVAISSIQGNPRIESNLLPHSDFEDSKNFPWIFPH